MTVWGAGSNSKNEKKKSSNPVGWGPGKVSQEGLGKKQRNLLLSAQNVEKGKLTIDSDKIAQSRGFINAMDESIYKTTYPAQYEASGGVKIIKPGTDLSGAPFASATTYDNDYALNLSNASVSKIVDRYNSRTSEDQEEIKNIIDILGSGEWQNAETMKKYSDKINSYANDYIALNELGYFNHLPDEERKNNVDLLKSLKEAVNSSKDAFYGYEDAYSYKTDNIYYLSADEIIDYIQETEKRIDILKNGDIDRSKEQPEQKNNFVMSKGKKEVKVLPKELSQLKENKKIASDALKSAFNIKYGSMTWEELKGAARDIKDGLLGKNEGSNSSSLQELLYVENILATQNKDIWDKFASFKELSIDERNDVLSEVTYGVDRYEEAKGYIDVLKKRAEEPEDTDGYVTFVKDWYDKNGTTDGSREAYGISKGYTDNRGQYSRENENNSQMLDYADTIAFYETKYGSKENLDKLAEQLTEYHENTNTNEEFTKYYTKMQSDPNSAKYIKKGKEIYETKNKNITDEEYDVVCYYLGKGEKDNYYLTWLKDVVYKREVAAASGWSAITDGTTLKYHRLWSDYTKSAPLEANAMSVALNLGAGAEFVYNTLNGNVTESKLSKASSKIREAYSNTHDGEFLGIDYDMWYNTAMSALDSLASAAMFGKVDKAGRVAAGVLALSAAASGINDALDRGMTGAQALLNGLANGVNEYIWEKFSLGELDKLAASNGAGFKTFITNLLKTVFVNASEETATETANILYDTVFNGDLSHYQLSIQRYLQSGLTESEAKLQASKDIGKQIKEAAVSGALMGFGFGVIGTSSAAINASQYGKYYYGFSQESVYALVYNGLAMPEGSTAYNQALKADARLKSGKSLSGTTLYNLATAIEGEIEFKSTERLSELGVDKKTAKELAPVVAKAVFGESLTVTERSALNNSEIAAQVVKELSADRANTVWKDAIKNNNVDFLNSANNNTVLHSESNNNIINLVGNDSVYANANTVGIGKTSRADVLSDKSGENYKTNNELYENKTLNELELSAVFNYKSSESYKINYMLRNFENLSDGDATFVKNMDSALNKMPTYQGTVYRNISFAWFGGQEAYDAFLTEHKVDDFVTYLAFTSSSIKEDGYLVDGHFAVSMVIESSNAKNIDGYGNNFESEVIFPRNSVFIVNNVQYNDKGQPIIYMTEVTENNEGKHGQFYPKECSETVQSLQKSKSRKRNSHLQDISDENTIQYLDRENSLQRVSGKERKLNEFDYEEAEKLQESFEDRVELRLSGGDGSLLKGAAASGSFDLKLDNILLENNTNAVTNPLSSYAPAKRGMIIDFLKSVDERLKAFVERVKNGSNKFERFSISDVSGREAADIKDLLGIDIDGYTHNINTNGIKHILKRHGVSGSHDHTMSNDNDIARMGWVIKNYDNVELLVENGEVVTSIEFKNKSNRPAPQIRYSKKINGTYYVVEAVFENDYNKLWVQSAYLKNEKEGVTQDPAEGQKDQPHDYARSSLASPPSYEVVTRDPDAADRPPMVTPKTPVASPTSNDNISQSEKTVNGEYWEQRSNYDGDNMQAIIEAVYGDSLKFGNNEVLQSSADGMVDSVNDFNYNDNSIKEGESYGKERLRNGGTWGQLASTDTQSRVGSVQETSGGIYKDKRESGIEPNTIYNQGNNRGIELSQEQVEGLKSTAIKNEDGTPKIVYHFTNNMDFEVFAKGDIGFHFGSESQARQRGKNLKQQGRIISAYLSIKNPVHINTDLMSRRPAHVAVKLYTDSIITYDQYKDILDLHIESGYEYNSPAAINLRKILADLGYDGIIYENHYEGDGKSYIAFYPEQIIIIDDGKTHTNKAISENGVAFLNSEETQVHGIDTDGFIKGLLDKDSNSVTEQGEVLQSTAGNVADSGSDDIVQHSGQGGTSAEIGSVQNNPDRAAPGVVQGTDGKQYFDDGSRDSRPKLNVTDYKLNNISKKDYDKFFFKKSIKVSKKDWAKVDSARMKKYSQYAEEDIPDIDFFRIAKYNEINVAYRYYIRNYDKYNFEIVSKIKIKEEHNDVKTTYTNVNADGLRRGVDIGSSGFVGYGQAISSDDKLVERSEESYEGRTVNNGDSDSGRKIGNIDITKEATSQTQVASFDSGEKQTDGIDADEFIKALRDENRNGVTERSEILQSTADGVVDSVNDFNYNDNSIKEGESYNGENTELLERGEVSTAYRGNDILRNIGTNSGELAVSMDISQGANGAFRFTKRTGKSGWLDERKNITGEKTRKSFDASIHRRIRGVKLSGKDTAGGIVSPTILERFKNTICKDENGNLISLYHWTQEIFEEFAKGEFGFHFGTLQAACDRYLQTKEEKPNVSKGIYKEVILNITNPIEISDEAGEWNAYWVALQLLKKGVISEQEYNILSDIEGFYDNTYDNPAAQAVRNILAQNGYDGIIYENSSEDVGSYSLIALYPEQIITVAENGVLKENSGVSRAISGDEVASFDSGEKQNNVIEADEFIQGLLGKDSNSVTERSEVLQSSADGVVDSDKDLNYNDNSIKEGEYSGIYQRRGLGTSDEETGRTNDSGKEAGVGGIYGETKFTFQRRTTETYGKNGRTVSHLNITVGYKESNVINSNSSAGVAYNILKSKGYNVAYCDGPIRINNNKYTTERNQAVTIFDGTIYISSDSTLNGEDITLHEVVHVWQYGNNAEYLNYESIVFQEIDPTCEVYKKVASQINDNHYNGRYDIEDIKSFEYIMRELTAYISQYVCTNPKFAREKFGGMFGNWDNVVQAVYDLNNNLGFGDIIKEATSKTQVAFSMPIGKRKRNVENNVVELSKDNELSKKIGDLHGAAKYKVIQQYILDVLSGQEIVLSDGKIAVVDKSDAQHIARGAGDKKTTQISDIKKIIEKAVLVAEEDSTKERKFDCFCYYEAKVKYDGETFNVYINVGRATNNKSYHIYDITQKLRDTAHRINDVGRPPINKGCAVETVSLNNIVPKTAQSVNNDYSTNTDNIEYDAISEREQKYIQTICDKLGRAVVFEDLREMYYKGEIISPDGYIENGVIHLNTYAENPIGFVFKHELTHFAEKTSGYAEVVNQVKRCDVYKKWLCEKMGESDVKIAEYKYKRQVAQSHSDIYSASDPKAEAEMIADFVGEMLFTDNGSGMASLVSDVEVKHRNKVVQFVVDFISWLKKKIGGIKSLTLELSKLEDRFKELLSDVENIGVYGDEVKFSIKQSFYTQLDNWDKEAIGFSFVVGKTSDALLKSGVPDKQIRWDASKIKTLLSKHNGMTVEIVRQIPDLLENPVVVIDSKQNQNSRIAIGELKDNNGKLVTVVLLLTPTSKKGNQLDVVKISSAQGRGHIESLFKKQDGSFLKIWYVDKKRIQSWLNVNRLQLPLHSFNLDSDNIISNFDEDVNKKQEVLSSDEVAFSMQRDYSYETLINKPDVKITEIDSFNGQINNDTRKEIIDKAVENAALVGRKNDNGNAVVYVNDIDVDVILSKSGLRHGFDRRFELLAPVVLKSGEILSNSIRINELTPRDDNIGKSYILVGVAKNTKNEPYVVSFVVNKVTSEVQSIDVLYAINAKTEPVGSLSPSVPANTADYFTDSTISISKLLNYVNKYFPDILPENVLRHYGYDARPEGKLGESALFSMPIGNRISSKKARYINAKVNSTILNFIQKVKNGVCKDNEKAYLEKPTPKVAEHIKNITKIDVNGFDVVIEARQIKHIIKDHGENGATDHSMSNDSDIAKIEYVLNSPDSIVESGTTHAYVTVIDGKNKPATTVLYEKDLGNNSYYVVQAVPDTKAKTLYIVSAFIGKMGYKKETSQTIDANSPDATPYSENASVSTSNIPDSSNFVNGKMSQNTDNIEYDAINEQEQKYIQTICDKLGRAVVFEDLREMYYKGKIISPDGYIENGVIHLNLYAENPIGFVFKHELTHFAEKASGYAEFVRGVKDSGVYKKWLCEKMGESDIKIAEYKYKRQVANTHSDIYSASDPKAEAEMIADFVGEMMFTDNGSGMLSLVSDVEVKHRNKVVQFVLDLISYLKKKLSGIKSLTLELSKLEDRFNELLSDAKNIGGYGDEVKFSFGITQKDIDDYVDAAYNKENTEDYKKYAIPTQKLIDDVSDEIDITDYSHALRDNDIRHIKNSHGEGTNEKYPVTSEDIKLIPWIVQNYDKVFVVKRDNGRTGIIYVKVNEEGLLYFLEQVTTTYGSEPLLVNKQMIKTGINDIPNLKGFVDAINKKQSETEFLADLKKVHEVYARSVYQPHFNNIIPKRAKNVNNDYSTNTDNVGYEALNIKERNYIQKICNRLGVRVVFEDLRNIEDKDGNKISPDGYVERKSGVVHLNLYAENPIGFVLKHELTHFGEKAKERYAEFAKAVCESKMFERWLIEKTGEQYFWDALDKYKQYVAQSDKSIKSIDDSKVMREIVADFVGDMLFTDNGSGLVALSATLEAKQRNIVVQYVLDFISWLKSKFIGQKSITRELALLEDGYRKLIAEAVHSQTAAERDGNDISSQLQNNENSDIINNERIELSYEHKAAILRYKSGEAYTINAKLQENETLDESEQYFVNVFNEALQQLPIYEGTVYRTVVFDDFGGEEAYSEFLEQYAPDRYIISKQFLSCSKEQYGYPVEGELQVHFVFESKNTRDVDGYGNNMESEVIYPINSVFIVDKVLFKNNIPTIYLQEAIVNVRYNTDKISGNTVQHMQASYTAHTDLQGISQRNTDGDISGGFGSQHATSIRQRDTLRTGGRQDAILPTAREEHQEQQVSFGYKTATPYIDINKQNKATSNGEVAFSMQQDDSDISFCFARCNDENLMQKAEEMEQQGESSNIIEQKLGVIRGVFGDWVRVLDINNYRLHHYGTKKLESITQKLGMKKTSISTECVLSDLIKWPEFFELFPKYKNLKVMVRDSSSPNDTARIMEIDGELRLIVKRQLLESHLTGKNSTIKTDILRELQRLIQRNEGKYTGHTLEYWRELEKKGKLPFSEILDRRLTAEDMMKFYIDNYEAEFAARRQLMKEIAQFVDRDFGDGSNSMLYNAEANPSLIYTEDEKGKIVSLKELNDKEIKNNHDSKSEEIDQPSKTLEKIKEGDFVERGEATAKVKEFVASKEKSQIKKQKIKSDTRIKGGNSGFLEKGIYDTDTTVYDRIDKHLEEIANVDIDERDVIGRRVGTYIQTVMNGSFAINKKGQPISLYVISSSGDDVFKDAQLGVVVGTIDMAVDRFVEKDKQTNLSKVKCLENYAIIKNPLCLQGEPYELSLGEIGFQLVEKGLILESEYLKMLDTKSAEKSPNYNNYITKALRELIKELGFDCIVYENSKNDRGSMAVVVFDSEQLIPVAEDGILIEGNGVSEEIYENEKFVKRITSAGENSKRLNNYIKEPEYNRRKSRKPVDSRLQLGNADFLEHNEADAQTTYEAVNEKLSKNIEKDISGYDTAGHKFKKLVAKGFEKCALKDTNGNILNFCIWDKNPINIKNAIKTGLEFGTINSALEKFFEHKENKVSCYDGVFEAFVLNCEKPLVVCLNKWDTVLMATLLLKRGKITQTFYERLLSFESVYNPTYTSVAAQKLRDIIMSKGYDSIILVKDSGEKTVIPFYESQVLSISKNGILNEECDAFEVFDENLEQRVDGEVIVPKKRTIRNFNEIKEKILSETDSTRKLAHLTEYMSCDNNSILADADDINIGYSGEFERGELDIWRAFAVYNRLVSAQARAIALNRYDTANRLIDDYVLQMLADTILKDENGRPLSFFLWNKHGNSRFKHSPVGPRLSTLTAAHDAYLAERAKHPNLKKGEYEEYFVNVQKPYFMRSVPKEFTPREFAVEFYENGILTETEYKRVMNISGIDATDYCSAAASYINRKLKEKGIDSIIYMNGIWDPGSMGIIVLDESRLIPVSRNGVPINNNIETQADSDIEPAFLMPENDGENFVEKDDEDFLDDMENSVYNKENIITDGSHLSDGKLKPNVKYKSGEYEYIYLTDDLGRISKVQADDLQYTERDHRKKHNSNTPGKKKGDHAGHLIGDRFGGSSDIDNLVSQSALVNLSAYKRIENQWAKAIKNGQKVTVNIEVKYDGESIRPSGFVVEYTIDGAYFNENIVN